MRIRQCDCGRVVIRLMPAFLALLVLGSGCATRGTVKRDPVRLKEQGTAGVRSDRLNAHVRASGTSREAGICAAQLGAMAQSVLMKGGFRIDPSAPDLTVSARAATDLFDKSGNYYVYDGRATMRVTRERDSSLIGEKTVSARGDRKLEKKKALESAGSKLASATRAWLTQQAKPANAGVTSVKLVVERAWRLGSDSRYARDLIKTVTSIPGVVSCRQVSHDYKGRKMVFRIAYIEDNFPEGILNRLVNEQELNLKASVGKPKGKDEERDASRLPEGSGGQESEEQEEE